MLLGTLQPLTSTMAAGHDAFVDRVQSGLSSTTTVGPNVDVAGEAFPDRQKAETTVAVDPRNPNIIVAGAQDYNLQCCSASGHRWHGYYRSIDDGRTWTSSLLPGFPGDTSLQGLSSPLRNFQLTTDPVLAFDRTGNVYYVGIAINVTANKATAFAAKYVNDGANYASTTLIPFGTDKPWIAIDTSGRTNDGNVYLIYQMQGTSVFVRSTDGGSTFSNPIMVPGNVFASGIAVDPTGAIYVASLGPSGTILVSKSTDAGLSLSTPVVAASGLTPIPQVIPQGNRFRVVTLPQIAADNRGVYVVTDDNSTGSMNVLFVRSFDGGITWSAPSVINDVSIGQHFDPTIAVSGGRISVAWYDSRLVVNLNGTMTALDVFYAQSVDAGFTFSANVRVTSVSFNPNLVSFNDFARGGSFIGDYIQIAATPTEARPVWSDTRNGCDIGNAAAGVCLDQDAFTATISLTTPNPDFAVFSSPKSLAAVVGTSGNSTVTLVALGQFSGSISLSTSVSPGTGLLASLNPTSVVLSTSQVSTSRLTVSGKIGTYTVTVTATNGTANGSHSTAVTVTVTDFSITASPVSLTVRQESSNPSIINLVSINGFGGALGLSVSVSPVVKSGPTALLNATIVTLSSGRSANIILTVSAKGATPLGGYTLAVTASIGTASRTVSIPITVVVEQRGV